jgi:hypothetical protein
MPSIFPPAVARAGRAAAINKKIPHAIKPAFFIAMSFLLAVICLSP